MAVDRDPEPSGGPPDDGSSVPPPVPADSRVAKLVTALRARLEPLWAKVSDRPIVDLALRVYQRDRESAGTVVGSAIAFRLFLFFVPLVLFLVGLAGFVGEQVDAGDVSRNAGVTGTLAAQIDTALSQPNSTRWTATLIGLFGMATAGRTLSKALVSTNRMAWRLPPSTKAPMRVAGAMVGLFAGVGLIASVINRIRNELGVGAASLSFVVAGAVYFVGWMVLSVLLPRATTDLGALIPGAVVVTVTITGMQAVSQLYLPDRISRASELYGAIGTTIVTLGWFFILGRAIVLATVLNAVVYERYGTIARLVFSLPILRILPRHSPRLRRWFDLDDLPAESSVEPPIRP